MKTKLITAALLAVPTIYCLVKLVGFLTYLKELTNV